MFRDELADDAKVGGTLAPPGVRSFDTMPLTPQKRIKVPAPKTLHRLGHLALEGEAPHFAVRDNFKAGLFL
jgi:hypothetical protein